MEIDLKNIYSTSLKLFTIIKEEYNIFLKEEQKKFIDELDVFHFYKVINDENLPIISYIGETYYLNTFYNTNFIDYLPFICLSTLCGVLNPLKIGLIELELENLKEKYALNYKCLHEKEKEVAEIVSKTILNNLPYKIIFLDNDAEIVNYLIEEKGSKLGCLYAKVSKLMKDDNHNNETDYKDIMDIIYDYVSSKVR